MHMCRVKNGGFGGILRGIFGGYYLVPNTLYQDQRSLDIVLRSLARTWRETQDAQIPQKISALLKISLEQSEDLLRRFEDTGSE
jgi:hypothetical protein